MMWLIASRNSQTLWTPIKLDVIKIKWGMIVQLRGLFSSHVWSTIHNIAGWKPEPNSSDSQLWLWSTWWGRIHVQSEKKKILFCSYLMPTGSCQKEEGKWKLWQQPVCQFNWYTEWCRASVHIWSQEVESALPSWQSTTFFFLYTSPSAMQHPVITNVPKAYIAKRCEPRDN